MRWLLIDEIEACGCSIINDTEEASSRSAGKLFKYSSREQLPRVFGGINVFRLGDFWQLPTAYRTDSDHE